MEHCCLEYCSEYTDVKSTAIFSFMQDVKLLNDACFSKKQGLPGVTLT